jgi:two-component system chemotaxis sensor kinase CheA
MSLSPALHLQLEDLAHRLAAETVFAQVGRDDGLIPAYNLLGQMLELVAELPEIAAAVRPVHAVLDRHLDEARPFDDEAIAQLRHFVEHFCPQLERLRRGLPFALPAWAGRAPVEPAPVVAAAVSEFTAPPDVMMDLQLEQNRELLGEFHAEALDHLSQIEAALLSLEQNPSDPEALSAIFRSFHTIKGVSGFLQLVPIHTLTHEVESLLDLVRNGKLVLDSVIVTEVLRSRDAIQELVDQVTAALERGQLPDRVVPVGHLIRSVKAIAAGRRTAGDAAAAAPAVPTAAPAPSVRESSTGEVVPFTPALEPAAAPATAESAVAPASGSAPVAGGALRSGPSTVRVSTHKLDSLMDVVGELVIVQSQLLESARHLVEGNTALQRNLAQVSRITKELQHTSMALRMIPVKSTFQKMERLARDLARDCGKKVQFVTEGEDTELDRTVVEEIGDPLVHMVRNSLDHGIEPADARLAAGKPEAGRVTLKAYHLGSNIVLELSDDGKGIDPDRVLAKARANGLVAEGQSLTREEIFQLIFLPGFSTAEKVTAISGRGVGMDVVRRNIERLRGKIELESRLGAGSRFRIVLPLTMAIIDGLVVKVGGDRFILPTTSVKMAYRPARESLSTVQGRGEVLDHRGKILPLHRLHEKFSIPAAVRDPWEGIVVVVESSGRTSGLLVDEMVSKQEVVIKNLGGLMQGLPGVAGGAILGDGHIALILDPASLLAAA